jgi:hypothetical protein
LPTLPIERGSRRQDRRHHRMLQHAQKRPAQRDDRSLA